MSTPHLRPADRVAIIFGESEGQLKSVVHVDGRAVQTTGPLLAAVAALVTGGALDDAQRTLLLDCGALRAVPDPRELPDVLALAPGTVLELHLEPGKASPGTGEVWQITPEDPATGLFVSPYRLHALHALWRVVVTWHTGAVRVHPTEAVKAGVGDLVHAYYASDYHLQGVVDLDASGLRPLLPLSESDPTFQPSRVVARLGPRRVDVQVNDWSELAIVRATLGALMAGVSGSDLQAIAGSSQVARGMLLDLLAAGIAGDHAVQRGTLNEGELVDLGRGSLLVRHEGANVLIDPWLGTAELARIPPVDAVVLTRRELARCPFETLLALEDVPIYLPPAIESMLPDRLDDLLRLLGFSRVVEVEPGTALPFGEALATADPSTLAWRFGNQLVLPGPRFAPLKPVAVDRVFLDPHDDREPAIFRRLAALIEPMDQWFEPLKPAPEPPEDAVWVDSEGRYGPPHRDDRQWSRPGQVYR